TSPLKHAGIDGWFEKSFSVDRVRRFKPAPQVYHMVAEELDVPPAAICMVAAHVWDTIGKASAAQERSLLDPAMLFCSCMACRSRRLLRWTFRVWPPNSASSGVDTIKGGILY